MPPLIFSYGEPLDHLPATVSENTHCEYSLPVLALEQRFAHLLLFSYRADAHSYRRSEVASLALYRLSACCGVDLLNSSGGLFVEGDAGDPHCEKCKRAFPDLSQRRHSFTFWEGQWTGQEWDSPTQLDQSVREWSELSSLDLFEAQLTLVELCSELRERLKSAPWLSSKNLLTLGL